MSSVVRRTKMAASFLEFVEGKKLPAVEIHRSSEPHEFGVAKDQDRRDLGPGDG